MMNPMVSESGESGPSMAEATVRLPKMLMENNRTFIRCEDSHPARKGNGPSVITVRRMRSQVLALSNTVKPNATPAPVIAANPAVTKKSPLGRAVVTAYPS